MTFDATSNQSVAKEQASANEVTIKIDDAFAFRVCHSAVGFLTLRDNEQAADVAGSGTLVQLGKLKGILTAGHAVNNLPKEGRIELVRFSGTNPSLQNLHLDMSHTDGETLWDGTNGHAPDLGFLKLPDHAAATIEAQGGVFYHLEKTREFVSSSPSNLMSKSHVVVGVVDEWSEEAAGAVPKTKKKIVGGLFGAAKSVREFKEGDAELLEVDVDYAFGTRVPESYGGVSGGALWELHVEKDGEKIVSVGKKLRGVAFRQSDDHSLVVCNDLPSIAKLIERIKVRWPTLP